MTFDPESPALATAATAVEPADSSQVPPAGYSYAERYVCRSSEPFVGRCRAAAKEHALHVLSGGMTTPPAGPPDAAVSLALRICLDQVGPFTIVDLVTADGTTSIGCTDLDLAVRWSQVFSVLALAAAPPDPATAPPRPEPQPQAVVLAPRPVPAG